ncbi:MAG: PAS domain-containing sensor histidine kinase, partial [Nitrospiria bacterium]
SATVSKGAQGVFPPSSESLKEVLKASREGKNKGADPLPLSIQSTPQGDLIRGVFPLRSGKRLVALLVVDQLIPPVMVEKMEGIKKSVEEYKQLKAFKNPIKGSYILSFLIIVLLIMFSAVWFGIYFARSITIPIQRLAEGTHAVAQGDLNFQIEVRATDELGVLVDSFNKMTADLNQGQEKIEEVNRSLIASNRESEGRRAYMEGVLQNIAAGVISVDEKGIITTFNPSAEKILNIPASEAIRKDFVDFFSSREMEGMTDLIQRNQGQREVSLEEEIIIEARNKLLTLRIALSILRGDDRRFLGFVIVFDDLTELIRAQKVATWQEVARRIAHEIRNPLTPIQLSTERLRKKYFQRSNDFHKIFDESTRTVINEVHGLKRLVDEFSEFARMPPPHRSLQKINPILQEVILLYQTSPKDIIVTFRLDERIPLLNLDRDQIKRVFVNLFENAVEAMDGRGGLHIATEYDASQQKVRVEVADEGVGIAPDDLDKLFLPYFSRKKTGTGLGLAIVNRIVTDHNGQIRVAPQYPKGTTFTIEFPVPA